MWMEEVVRQIQVLSVLLHGGVRKPVKSLNQDRRFPFQDLNPEPSYPLYRMQP